jgi:hypothetical protein
MNIEINEEESVAIHNAVIFMANDVMEEIVELEEWLKDNPEDEQYKEQLIRLKRRWDMLVNITEKVKAK